MKSPEEKKTSRVSLKMTPRQYDLFQRKAEERNMSVSAYVVDAAEHCDNQIIIPLLIRVQNLANMVADACEESDPTTATEIQKEVAALWSSLK